MIDFTTYESDSPQWFVYVAYVAGTDIFKVGMTRDPRTRRNALWGDHRPYVKTAICSALSQPIEKFDELKPRFQFVILEKFEDRAAAKKQELRYLRYLKWSKLSGGKGRPGEWFSFKSDNITP